MFGQLRPAIACADDGHRNLRDQCLAKLIYIAQRVASIPLARAPVLFASQCAPLRHEE